MSRSLFIGKADEEKTRVTYLFLMEFAIIWLSVWNDLLLASILSFPQFVPVFTIHQADKAGDACIWYVAVSTQILLCDEEILKNQL